MVNNGLWVSIGMGIPQNGWFIRKIPMKMDDDGGKNPLVNIQNAIENGP